jgi:hypothetical protein
MIVRRYGDRDGWWIAPEMALVGGYVDLGNGQSVDAKRGDPAEYRLPLEQQRNRLALKRQIHWRPTGQSSIRLRSDPKPAEVINARLV